MSSTSAGCSEACIAKATCMSGSLTSTPHANDKGSGTPELLGGVSCESVAIASRGEDAREGNIALGTCFATCCWQRHVVAREQGMQCTATFLQGPPNDGRHAWRQHERGSGQQALPSRIFPQPSRVVARVMQPRKSYQQHQNHE